MSRWEPDARGRLAQAALELYAERGYDDTTVAEIAERAGLTKRTYFRHFADKREVLFWGSEHFQELIVSGTAAAARSTTPLDAVVAGLHAVAEEIFVQERREAAGARHRIIAANRELQERELIKRSSLAAAVAATLRERGVGDPAAILAAEAGVTVFWVSFARWVRPGDDRPLAELIDASLAELRAATAA